MSNKSFRLEWLRFRASQMIAVGAAVSLPLMAGAAFAADAADVLDEVVVTGSSIKGAAPVGSNVITVGREQLEEIGAQTVQQVLKTVPAVVGLNSAGQGSYGSFDGAGTNAPTIHGLGASASNSTLVLINGHRLPLSGLNHTLGDPNILAPAALERVEVLTDGASSVYGSDAVAGVVNFITRRKYQGVEVSGQAGFGKNYDTKSVSTLAGTRWDTGSVLASYAFSDRSSLSAGNRSFTALNHTAQGGTDQRSNLCSPATIIIGTNNYYAPYSAASTTNNCDYSGLTDLLPAERRHSVFVSGEQNFGDRVNVSADLIYSLRQNRQNVARGSVRATIFGTGAANATQINPFFQLPAGVTGSSTTVGFQADDLLGPGAHIDSSAETTYASIKGQYRISDSWNATLGTVLGRDQAKQQNIGQLCVSCAYLALNGTTNASGNITTPSIPGTTVAVLGLPLTTANALDVFGVGTANKTSAATLARLTDSLQTAVGSQTLRNFYLTFNGSLFALPAGDVRAAIGGEYLAYTLGQDITRPTNSGPSSIASAQLRLDYDRSVKSAFVEVLVPIVAASQGITGVRSLEVNVSGRTDDYSDFGNTSNPKIAANWEVIEGFKLRGNWAKSFVAPALTSRGSNAVGLTGESGFTQYGLGAMNVPVSTFPTVTSIPGCATATITCTLGTTITGIQLNGGNGNLKPQTGKSMGFGFDWKPNFVNGLQLSATWWSNELRGGITSPVPALALNTAALSSLLTILPTPAQVAAATAGLPQTGALPGNVYFIYNYQQRNVLNLDVAGIDFDARYAVNTSLGRFNGGFGVTRKTKFDQSIGEGADAFSVLGTAGFNTTFPSLKLEGRANFGWQQGPIDANVYVNYTDSYVNWSGGSQVAVTKVNGVPTGGGAEVASNTTVDLNVSYRFETSSLGKTQVFLDATNLFDVSPPFYNSASGYDNINASPMGRVVTVGFRSKF